MSEASNALVESLKASLAVQKAVKERAEKLRKEKAKPTTEKA